MDKEALRSSETYSLTKEYEEALIDKTAYKMLGTLRDLQPKLKIKTINDVVKRLTHIIEMEEAKNGLKTATIVNDNDDFRV